MDIVSMVEELLELEEKLDHFYLTSRERREFQNEVMDRVMREEPQEKCEACKWFAICDIRDSTNEFCRFEPTEPQTECTTCDQVGRCERGRAVECPLTDKTDCAWK